MHYWELCQLSFIINTSLCYHHIFLTNLGETTPASETLTYKMPVILLSEETESQTRFITKAKPISRPGVETSPPNFSPDRLRRDRFPRVRVLKVLGELLGHFSPPSPESGQNSGPESVPGLLEQFLAGSTKSAPNHLADPTKIPLPKNPPGRVSMELPMQCNFFSMLFGQFYMQRRQINFNIYLI